MKTKRCDRKTRDQSLGWQDAHMNRGLGQLARDTSFELGLGSALGVFSHPMCASPLWQRLLGIGLMVSAEVPASD